MRAHFGSLAFSTVRSLAVITAAFAALGFAPARAAEVEILSGDTFKLEMTSWRIANIDAPKIENTCIEEARLGILAQAKLAELLAQGEMEIAPTGGLDMRQSKLALVRMNGEDIGEKMIAAGLAQRHGHVLTLCATRNTRDLGTMMPGATPMTPQPPSSRHMN
jgi:endonuclease YncB( thermonuclease family)